MSRWLIELNGETFDIDEFPFWFPAGPIHAIKEDGKVFLTGSAFQTLHEPAQVHASAVQILDECFAIISLLQANLQKPSIGAVIHEADDGTRSGAVFMTGTAVGRSKVRAVSLGPPGARTQAQELLLASRRDRRLQIAAFLLSNHAVTWPHLYRCLEEIESFLGRKVHEAGFCSANQRERFTRSANSAEVSGNDARHAVGRFDPPPNPMSLKDACGFLSQLMQAVLSNVAKSLSP